MNLWIHRGGQQFGPYSREAVQQYLAVGRIVSSDPAWTDGSTQWVPLSQLLAIKSAPAAPARLDIQSALFSFAGRMCRSDYWLKGVLPLLPVGILNNILAYGVGGDARILSYIIALASMWPALAAVFLSERLSKLVESGAALI
jgi:hypothetical protein